MELGCPSWCAWIRCDRTKMLTKSLPDYVLNCPSCLWQATQADSQAAIPTAGTKRDRVAPQSFFVSHGVAGSEAQCRVNDITSNYHSLNATCIGLILGNL
jgi:hypothetical protein